MRSRQARPDLRHYDGAREAYPIFNWQAPHWPQAHLVPCECDRPKTSSEDMVVVVLTRHNKLVVSSNQGIKTTTHPPFCTASESLYAQRPNPCQRALLVNSLRCSCEPPFPPFPHTRDSTLCTRTHAPPSPYPAALIRGVFGCSGTKRLITQLRDLSRFNRSQFDCLSDGHCGLWRLLHFLCPHLHQVHSSSDANDGHNPASYPSD